MKRFMRTRLRHSSIALAMVSLVLVGALAGQEPMRKVVSRTAPVFPELAKRMHLSGKVRVEAVISPGGAVTSAKLVGGNPVFEQSAVEAVKQWKFETGPKETKAVVTLEFAEQ